MFTVVDLSSVWVVGALYERDFSRVRVGSAASVTTTADPGLARQGRVSYIDPQVSADTRTARVRVEVPNPRQELRLGMYADIEVAATANRQAVMVPRIAVQNVSDRQVVYVANPAEPGKFTEREVHLGDVSGEQVEVVSGVQPGDQVVSKGSFPCSGGTRTPRPAAGHQHIDSSAGMNTAWKLMLGLPLPFSCQEVPVMWIVRNMRWIMLVSGFLTATMVQAAVTPERSPPIKLRGDRRRSSRPPCRPQLGALIALVGGMLIYGAFTCCTGPLVLVVGGASQIMFVALVLSQGARYPAQSGRYRRRRRLGDGRPVCAVPGGRTHGGHAG